MRKAKSRPASLDASCLDWREGVSDTRAGCRGYAASLLVRLLDNPEAIEALERRMLRGNLSTPTRSARMFGNQTRFEMATDHRSITLSGVSLSPGLASGAAFVFEDIFERDISERSIGEDEIGAESARLDRAIADVLEALRASAAHVEAELDSQAMGDIFRAHEALLLDPSLVEEIRKEICMDCVKAECSVRRVIRRWERRFRSSKSESIKLRGEDLRDLGRRLLKSLSGKDAHSLETMPKGSILVARALLPSDTIYFTRRSVAGIAVETGGRGSHCALLTRQMGIPGIAQVHGLVERISAGDLLLLDGLRGKVTVAPDEATSARFKERVAEYRSAFAEAERRREEPAITRDGVTIPVMANIGARADAELALQNGADGVGLFRLEILFLSRSRLPTEDELADGIAKAIEPMKGKPISVRLLDIGGDKNLAFLPLPSESNPFLGRRGVRVLLEQPQLLGVQLRALMRLSQEHDIRIIVPMVALAEDMRQVRTALEKTAVDLGINALPQLGAMIETPAAALCAEELATVSDFFNIGTNDLTQYTMAAGRENESVARYFRDDHPAVFKLIKQVGDLGRSTPVGICGELASQTEITQPLLSAGIHILSVAPPTIPSVKEAVRRALAHPDSVRT